MNLIVAYNNDLRLLDSEYDIFLLAQKGLNSHYQVESDLSAIELIHSKGKQVFGWINRFIFEPEMDITMKQVQQLIDLGVDGFMVNDFGLLLKLKEIGFNKPIYLSTDTTITNHLEIEFLVEQGFDKIVTARELTFDEICDLALKQAEHMVVPIFGHQIISTSRRQLLEAYGDLIKTEYQSNQVYHLRESTRDDRFLCVQDETGTHIFDEKVFVGFEGLNQLLELNIQTYLVDHFNLSTELLIEVSKYLKKIENQELTVSQSLQQLQHHFPELLTTSALWHLKTTDKKD